MKWKEVGQEKPLCLKKGDWDGEMSEPLLLMDKNGLFIVGVCYMGIIDGSEFCNFYDTQDYELKDVTHFCEIIKPK